MTTLTIPKQLQYSTSEEKILNELNSLNVEHLNTTIDKMVGENHVAWDNDYFHVKGTKRGYLVFSSCEVTTDEDGKFLSSKHSYIAQTFYGIEKRWNFDYGRKQMLKYHKVDTREQALAWVLEQVKSYKPRNVKKS